MDFSQFDLTDPFVRRALAETLAEDNGLDYQDEYIRKALNDEIAAAAAPKPIDGERNFLGDTVSPLARGGVQLADTALHAVDTAVGGSETLQGWSDGLDKARQNVGLLRPDKSEHEEGWLKRSYGQALESAPMSAVPWAGAMAGASMGAVAGPAGVVAGGLIGGTLAMGGLFGLGTYGQRKEEIERELTATRPDLTPDEISKMAHDNAKSYAFAETGGESAGDLASWAILSKVPGGQAIFKGGKAVLAELVKPNAFKAIALGIGKSMPFEVGSEVGTAIWQNEADKAIGVEQGTSADAALAAIGPALFLSAGMGVAAGGYSANQRRVQYNALNSEDQELRAQAVDQVAGTLAEATDQQTAKKWRDMALGFVQNNQPIPLDMNLAELSANEPESAIPEAQDKPAETILKAESVDEAIQEAEAEIAKPGWLAPTAPDLEESAWLQQGAASKAYNQGRNELGATPVSRAGLLGQAMEPMQVAPPILTETNDVEESNVGRGTVQGDQGGVAAVQPEQPAGVRDTEPVSADSGQLGDGEGGAGVEQTSPLLTAARQHVAETGDLTMGGLMKALDVDIDTAEALLEQVKATTPLPRSIGATAPAPVGADTGGFLNDQAIRKAGATSPATTAGDAQGFIADQGIRKAAGAVTAATVADTEGFVRDQQLRRDAMGRGPKPTRAADEPARAFLARKREWEKSEVGAARNLETKEIAGMTTDELESEDKRLQTLIAESPHFKGKGRMPTPEELDRAQDIVSEIFSRRRGKDEIEDERWFERKESASAYLERYGYAKQGDGRFAAGKEKPYAEIEDIESFQGGHKVKLTEFSADIEDKLHAAAEASNATYDRAKRLYQEAIARDGIDEANRLLNVSVPNERRKKAASVSQTGENETQAALPRTDETQAGGRGGDSEPFTVIDHGEGRASIKVGRKYISNAGGKYYLGGKNTAFIFNASVLQPKVVYRVAMEAMEIQKQAHTTPKTTSTSDLPGAGTGTASSPGEASNAKNHKSANIADVPEADFGEMVKEAARWRGAAQKVAKQVAGDKKASVRLMRMTTKGDLDAYLMRKYGLDQSGARDVSNYLTAQNIPHDMTANIEDFADEPWVTEFAAQPSASKATPEKPAGVATSGQRQEQAKLLTKAQFNDEAQQYANFGKYSDAVASDESPSGIALRQDIRAAIEAYREDFREKARQVENKLRKWFDIPEGDIKDEIDKAVIALLNGESAAGGGHLHVNGGKLFTGRGTRAEQSAKKIANANGTSVVFGYTDNAVAGAKVDDGDFIIELPFDMSDYGKGDGRRIPFLLSSNFRLSGDWAYTPKQPWATRGKPPLIGEYSDFMSKQEQTAKEPWQMTREEYLADALERNEYRDQYKANPKLLPPFEENAEREWRRSVEKAAEATRVPDAVLDSYLKRFGKQVFSSTFRGVAEKGVQGYLYPDVRAEQLEPLAEKKKAAYDLKPYERTWAQQRGEERKAMGRMLTKAEWKELREQHKSAVQKALWNGEKVPASVLADYPELADAKPRKEADMADVAETDFGNIKEGDIYPTTVSGKKMYAIRGDNPRGGGDSLFGTSEEAQAEIERSVKMKAANEKSRAEAEAKEDAKNKAEAEREAKRKAELASKQTLWFDEEYIAGLSDMPRGRLMKALDKRYNTRDGERTLREYIESGGFTGTDVSEVPVVQYDRAKCNRMDSREQAEYDKRLEEKKTEYRVTRDDDTSFQIPKIVFDAIRKDSAQPAQAEAASGERGEEEAPLPTSPQTALAAHLSTIKKMRNGEATIAEYRESFERVVDEKEAIIEELSDLTKAQIFERFVALAYRYKNEKKAEIVRAAYSDMVMQYNLSDSFSYMLGQKVEDVMRQKVEAATQADLDAYAEERKAARQAAKEDAKRTAEALQGNIETMEEYRLYLRGKVSDGLSLAAARRTLPVEVRAKFDDMEATETRERRAAMKAADRGRVTTAAVTTSGEVIETKHTKTGEPLFVVKAAERVERDVYNEWNRTAKRMGGWYSSYRAGGAVPGFQFKTRESADAFAAYLAGETGQVKDIIDEWRSIYEDNKEQSAVERLRSMADSLEERADERLSADRLTNTTRRARMAASAGAAAEADKAMAATMRNIAAAIESGAAKFLDRVRAKVQVEMLLSKIRSAQNDALRERYPNDYSKVEEHKHEKPTAETADYVEFPRYRAFRSDLASIARQLAERDGSKRTGESLLKVADDVTSAYLKFAKENLHKVARYQRSNGDLAIFASKAAAEAAIKRSGHKGKAVVLPFKRAQNIIIMSPQAAREAGLWQGDDDKLITLTDDFGREVLDKAKAAKISVPWMFEVARDQQARLKSMGIETPAELRAAVREFIDAMEVAKQNKVRELELAMSGRRVKDGLDFFPTPESIARDMVDTAGIEEGMSVLEPSAGMGHIAEVIRETGVDPDVVELSGDRRELLEAKGFRVVGNNFMEMSPRGFTFGDTYKAPDGTVGIMRGAGGMGSDRVRLVVNGDERTATYQDRDDLVPVKKNGSNSGYDRIVMNPPFSDRRDIEHVQHAYELLKPGGRLVSIMGEGSFFGSDKKAVAFREWLESVGGTSEKLPEGTFNDKSLPVTTGVNTRMVVIDKPIGAETPVFDEKREAVEAEQTDPTETATVEPEAETETAAESPPRLHTVSGYPSDNATKKHMLEAIAEARKELPEPSPKDGFSNAERIDWPKPTTEKSRKIYRLAGNFKLVVDPTGYARLVEDMGSSGKDGSKIPDKVHGKPIGNLAEAKLWAEYYLLGKTEPSGPPHVFRGKNKEYEYTIPNSAYALDNFEKKVKGSSGVKFAKALPPSARADIPGELTQAFGKLRARVLMRKITVLESQEKIKALAAKLSPDGMYSEDGAIIQAFAHNGHVYMAADGVETGHVVRTLKHEFAHIARLGLRGTTPWQALLRSVDERMNEDSATGKALREARKKVPADTDADLIAEETLAYAVELSPEVGLVRRAIAMIKRFLVNMGVSSNIFTVEDWSALAAATLRGQARVAMGEGVRQSVRDLFKPVDTESAAFKRWFGDSKVVDGAGRPLVVYHHTLGSFEAFAYSNDIGFHFGTKNAALDRAEQVGVGEVGIESDSGPSQIDYDSKLAADDKNFSLIKDDKDKLYFVLLRKLDAPRFDLRSVVDSMTVAETKEALSEYGGKPDSEQFFKRVERASAKIKHRVTVNGEVFGEYEDRGSAVRVAARKKRELARPLAVYLRIENPIRLPDLGVWPAQEIAKEAGFTRGELYRVVQATGDAKQQEVVKEILKERGHDGIVYENEVEERGSDSYIVFDPTQIKSATENTGDFSPTDPRIRYSKQFDDGEAEAAMQVKSALKKNDLKWWERIFKTFDYLSRIDPAAKRIFQYGAEDRRENKVRLEDRILDDISVPAGAYIDPQYAEKKKAGFVAYLTELQKKDKATYTAANDYLLQVDRTGKAFAIKRQEGYTVTTPDGEVLASGLRTKEDGYAVIRSHHAANSGKGYSVLMKDYGNDKKPSWIVTDPKGAVLSEHDTENEAVVARRETEAEKMRADGKDEKTIAAVMKFREMTDRAFDLMAGDLRRVIDEAERLGLDEPTMEVVDERKRYVILDARGNKVPESYYENRKDAEAFAKSISHKGRFQVKRQADNEILMPMTLSAAIAQMGDLRGSYFPRQRQHGAVVMTATKDGHNIRKNFDLYALGGERVDIESGEVITESKLKTFLRDRANQYTPLGREMAKLKADGYAVKVAPAEKMPETVFEATQLFASINALIEDAAKGVKEGGDPNLQQAYNELAKTLTMSIADTFKQRGYLSSRMKRVNDYWEGFEADMLKAGVQYAKGMAGGLAKREAAQKMTLALTGREVTFAEYVEQNPDATWQDYQQFVRDNAIDPKKQPRLLEETKSWMKEMLRNDEQADRILGTIKGLAVLKFLGFRVSSAAVNMTNMVQAVPATIAAQTGTSISRALGQVGSSARLYKQYRTGRVEQADKEIFTEISERGWDNPQFNHEAAAVLRSKAGNWFAKFTDAAMWMFGQAEKVNRAVTIHAAYMQAKRMSPDLGHVGWMNKAKQISDDAHGVYGKETAPAWTRGAYNPLKLSYTFQRFMHNYFLNMGQMWERGKYKELTWMLISPVLIAGPGATLLTPIAASMLGALGIGGDDPEEEFYTWAEQTFGEGSTGARVARHGFSGALGVNLKGSIEMGFAMPTTVAELFGAPGSLVTDAVDSVRAFGKGEVSKGFEKALPTGMGTMLKANREQREGITTGGYSPIWYGDEPLKTTGGGSVARFFGFNPSVTSGVREKLWSEKRIEQKYASERKRINDRIRRLVLQNGGRIPREDMDEIRGEVARYNERARGLSIPGVPLIKASTIRQAIRSAMRQPRKERLRSASI